MDLYKEKIKFPFKCPVCGKEEFTNLDWFIKEENDNAVEVYKINPISGEKIKITDPIEIHFVHCGQCGWMYDLKQVLDYDVPGDRNILTVNEYKKEYYQKIKDNPNYNFDEDEAKPIPHKCPICGDFIFKNTNSYDICPVCGWIDDGTDETFDDQYSEVNVSSISEAQEVFKQKRKNNPKYKWTINKK